MQSNAGLIELKSKKSKSGRSKKQNEVEPVAEATPKRDDTLQSNALVDLDGQEGIYDDIEASATSLKPRSKKSHSSRHKANNQ